VLLATISYSGLPQEGIAYRSVYASVVILYIVTLAIIAKLLPSKSISPSESPYIDDSPAGHDGAEPYETQRRIVADVKRLIEGGRPSTIAITGHWGIGKTFLLLRAKHEVEYDDSIIWMNFEPWRYASEEALIRGFYQDIGATLAEEIPGMQHITKPLAETTDKFVRQHDGTGIFGTAMDALRVASTSNDNPEDQIRELLDQEGRRLVIVIDDVERSFNPEQIFRTLQLAHFAKNIDNVQVVFLYEKDVVLKACPAHLVGASQTEYLEKFVEVEVFVPSPRPSELRQLFTSFMGIHRNREGFDFTESDLSDEMLYAVNTPRLVKLLANEFVAFRFNLEEGQNESR
jgi:predicted KAP-like P-loop ATPase